MSDKELKKSIYDRYIPAVIPPSVRDDSAWWFVFSSNKLLVRLSESSAGIPFAVKLENLGLKSVREQYLGTLDGYHCYSAEADADVQAPDGMDFKDLRSLFGVLEEDMFLLSGRAFQIVSWDQTHQYCGRCGAGTETKQDERAKVCPKCGFISYPRISPAVIAAVVRDGQLLLAHAKHFRENWYSVIAGFVEPGETFEDCVKREVMEEVGIKVKNLKYFGSQPWPFPNSLMVAFTAEYESGEIKVDGIEIGDAGWYKNGSFPDTPTTMTIAGRMIEWFKINY